MKFQSAEDKLKSMKRILYVMVGLPRSGKSTIAKGLNCPIVNKDSIRLALHGQIFRQESESMVTAIETLMVDSLLIAGHDKIVIDATNTISSFRDKWRKVAIAYDMTINFIVCNASKVECMERAEYCDRQDLIPVIEKMSGYLTNPSKDENKNILEFVTIYY